MVQTIKFSQFVDGGTLVSTETIVGLLNGLNTKFTSSTQFVTPFTTATRPIAPTPGTIGFNTTTNTYEWWNGTKWLAFGASSDLQAFIDALASNVAGPGFGSSLVGLQNQSGVSSKTSQNLANAQFVVNVNNASLENAQALGSLGSGILKSTTGTGILSISTALTSIDNLVPGPDMMLYTTATNIYAATPLTAYARTLLANVDAVSMRSSLGLGTASTQAINFFLQAAQNLSDLTNVATARTNLGLGTAAVKNATDNTQPNVASTKGAFFVGHTLLAGDTLGTIVDSGFPGATGTVMRVDTGTGLTGGPITTTGTIRLEDILNNMFLANTSGGSAPPIPTPLSTLVSSSNTNAGVILRSNGANFIPSTSTFADTYAVNNLLVSSPANTIHGLATANNAVLVTDAAGVPSLSTTLPAGLTIPGYGAGGTGTVTSVATNNGLTGGTITTTGTLGLASISALTILSNITGVSTTPTGNTLTAILDASLGSVQGDILYRDAASWAILPPGTGGQVLSTGGPAANPSWIAAGGTGTVTSITVGSGLTGSVNPITTTGTISLTSPVTLALGGTGAALTASLGGVVYSTATALGIVNGTATSMLPLLSQASAAPIWGAFALALGGALTTSEAVTFSGAFPATFNLTGSTNVTFPTSGTLATTAGLPALPLSLSNGGTGTNLTASLGGIFYSTATTGAILAGTPTANKVLMSGANAAPTWSTATYPTLASTSGNVLTSDGTNFVSSPPVAVGGLTALNYLLMGG